MFPLFETILVKNGKIKNLAWHQKRVCDSCKILYGSEVLFNLCEAKFNLPKSISDISKLRISYNQRHFEYKIEAYQRRPLNSLKIVYDDQIDYGLKYNNRTALQELFKERGDCDDILIIKNGLVTDSSYTNIVFFDGQKWVTPSQPLLLGTARARLISEQKIIEAKISINNFKRFKSYKLINALRDFETSTERALNSIKF